VGGFALTRHLTMKRRVKENPPYRDTATAELNPLADLGENVSLMHGVHSDWPIRAD